MCGIVGAISVEPLVCAEDTPRLDRAIDCLAHRGPDDRGRYVSADRRAFLGHRRLSIIDLAGGHQPIADECERRRLCYNGEIYNFRALRETLTARGHVFRTHTDGEPALHLYEDDPDDFVTSLQGMYAIAILDEANVECGLSEAATPSGLWRDRTREKSRLQAAPTDPPAGARLTLARDRNGIKPLYYYSSDRTLIFASEIKAILALLPGRPAISPRALRQYLRWKYVPAPLTIYEGIQELPAAHMLVARSDTGGGRLEVSVRRYWDIDYGGEKLTDEREAIELLDAGLRAAVEGHLEADVEVGALLSGGVDSSLVVAMAARVSRRPIKTFTVGFKEQGFDQLPFARTLAEACRTEHHEEYVDLDPMATAPKLVRQFDQPFADSSALACYRVCEVAGRHVKVALTGDGGDESFAGYRRYAELQTMIAGDGFPGRLARKLAAAVGAAIFSPEAKFLTRLRGAGGGPLTRFVEREVMCSAWLTNRLLATAYRETGADDDLFAESLRAAEAHHWPLVEAAQYADMRTYLPGDILRKVDRTSMAWSLECRPPLLDHTITEFSARLPINLKIRDGVGKYILKRVAERYVPPELLYRKKMGFRVPIRRWFKGTLLERTAECLHDGELVSRGILDPAGVEWVLRSQRRPWMNLSSCLWALLFLEHWARAYLD